MEYPEPFAIRLSTQQLRALEAAAAADKRSVAFIVREAIDAYLAETAKR